MKGFYYKPKTGDRIVVLTGAGISAESGIRNEFNVEEVATPQAFIDNPDKVMNFYRSRANELKNTGPNAAHTSLAVLEAKFKDNFTLITQNIDNLHQKAGSRRILSMHGELSKGRCSECGYIINEFDYLYTSFDCPVCKSNKRIRPHVVWFGEIPLYMDEILNSIDKANLFVAIGTSGSVYPASMFVEAASGCGATTVLINTEPPENSSCFEFHLYGKAARLVPDFVNHLMANTGE
ncbi:MAG: NAD-dependent deacylase [Oligoflexia bacterium]|nr:NAD-dependent deacylase [Oligoflexia bacterium]